jgi:hypothetical protein
VAQHETKIVTMSQALRLCLPPFAFALLDAGMTLLGQPSSYWQGDFSTALEWNPVGD